MASNYHDDYREPPRSRRDRAPYPEQDMDDYDSGPRDKVSGNIPPPPVGDNNLRPAMKRGGSQSRVSPDTRPQFPEEASYLGGRAPDLEAKNRPQDRAFRDMRDGYESDEGETHRKRVGGGRSGRRPRDDDESRGPPRRQPHGRDAPSYPPDESQISRRSPRDDPYDDAPAPRRRRDPYDDDDYPPPRSRRGDRRPPEVEYGSDPIPARERRHSRRPAPRRRDDYYDDDDEDDYRKPRRRRSFEDNRRPSRRDEDYFSDDRDAPRRRRDRDRYDDDNRRRDNSRSRRRNDDGDDDDYDDDRRNRNKRKSKPTEMKIGNFDVGSLVDKGQKHWATLAPIVAPLVMSMVRSKMGGSGSGSGSGRSRSSRR